MEGKGGCVWRKEEAITEAIGFDTSWALVLDARFEQQGWYFGHD